MYQKLSKYDLDSNYTARLKPSYRSECHRSSPAVAKFPPGGKTQQAQMVKETFTPKRAR
jgi:hypothetical protein